MLQNIASIINSPVPKIILLFVAPTTVIGLLVFPNATVYFLENSNPSFDDSNVLAGNLSADGIDKPCEDCHYDISAEIQSTPHHRNFECTVCHDGMNKNISCLNCHEIAGFHAHQRLIDWAENSTLMYSSNEACIACHTSADIQIYNVSKDEVINIGADIRNLHM
jgi:hypothetical protein